jgi:hypothetical protein
MSAVDRTWPTGETKKFQGPFRPATGGDAVPLAFGWAPLRRRFYDFHQATTSPLATAALAWL